MSDSQKLALMHVLRLLDTARDANGHSVAVTDEKITHAQNAIRRVLDNG